MPELNSQTTYEFADFRLIPQEGLLLRNGESIPLAPKVFETLRFLLERRGTLVRKAELMDQVWADCFVEENAVSKSVWAIRNALGEDPKNPRFIQTVPKRGYRFVGEVTESGNGSIAAALGDEQQVFTERRTASTPHVPARNWFRNLAFAAIAAIALVTVLFALRGSFSASDRVEIRSMTVIPLENVSGDPAEQYFVSGVTDSLIADLSRIDDLKIIALPADLRDKPEQRDPKEIGHQLNVDALLTGSVWRSVDRVRVVVQVIDSADGRNLWSNSYERDQRDTQRLHEEVTRDLIKRLRLTLSPELAERLAGTRPVVPEAYDWFLRGRFYSNTQNLKDQDTAIAALEQAVQIDPTFATAHADLSLAYSWKQFSFAPDEKELEEKAFISMQKALALDPNNASAFLARGRVRWTPWNNWPHETVIKDYQQSIALDPNLAEARSQLAIVYSHIGLLDEALVQAKKGVEIDPTNNVLNLRIGQTLNSQMKFEEALSVLSAIPIEIHPAVIGHQTAWALFNLGRVDEALEKVEQLEKDNPDKGGTFAAMKAVIEASRGNTVEAEKLIVLALENGKGYGHFHHTAYTIACAYALMNKPTEAIQFLEQAAETGFPCYPQFDRDKNLNNIRKDPRFVNFLASQKERWEHFKSLV